MRDSSRSLAVQMGGPSKVVWGPWITVWKGVNLFMAAFFLLASLANVNDDDWYIWVPVYFVPALLCLTVVVNHHYMESKVWGLVAMVCFTVCLLYTIYQIAILVEAMAGKLKNPLQHEEGRETGGLLIIVAWTGICRFTSVGRSSDGMSNQSLLSALLLMTTLLAVVPLVLWSLCFVSDWHTKIGHCNGMFT